MAEPFGHKPAETLGGALTHVVAAVRRTCGRKYLDPAIFVACPKTFYKTGQVNPVYKRVMHFLPFLPVCAGDIEYYCLNLKWRYQLLPRAFLHNPGFNLFGQEFIHIHS